MRNKYVPSLFQVLMFFFLTFTLNAAAQAADVIEPKDFIVQIIDAIKGMGGASVAMIASSIIMLLIASMKVSFLKPAWQKLGALQIWLAPVLGLIAGVLHDVVSGGPISLAKLFTYLGVGAGSVFLHEILDLVKAIPGLGAIYVSIIDIAESTLGGK